MDQIDVRIDPQFAKLERKLGNAIARNWATLSCPRSLRARDPGLQSTRVIAPIGRGQSRHKGIIPISAQCPKSGQPVRSEINVHV
jgi:hypothetical protein